MESLVSRSCCVAGCTGGCGICTPRPAQRDPWDDPVVQVAVLLQQLFDTEELPVEEALAVWKIVEDEADALKARLRQRIEENIDLRCEISDMQAERDFPQAKASNS